MVYLLQMDEEPYAVGKPLVPTNVEPWQAFEAIIAINKGEINKGRINKGPAEAASAALERAKGLVMPMPTNSRPTGQVNPFITDEFILPDFGARLAADQ